MNENDKALQTFISFLSSKGLSVTLELVIFFKDLTWLKGGQEAILITEEFFYYYQWGFKMIKLCDIEHLSTGGFLNEKLIFKLKNGQVFSIWAAKYFTEIKEVILSQKVRHYEKLTVCTGCRATVNTSNNRCDYCRKPIGSC